MLFYFLICLTKPKTCTLPFPKQALVFTCLHFKSFENTVGKGQIACSEQYLLYQQCFLPVWIHSLPFSSNSILSSANSFQFSKSLKFFVWERAKQDRKTPLKNTKMEKAESG